MNPRSLAASLFLAAMTPAVLCASPKEELTPTSVPFKVDWPSFLGRQDLVWEQLPRQWNEGAFVGNGQLGMMAYADLNANRFTFHLGRADVTDHRKAPDRKTSMGTPGAGVMFDFPRLDVGRMVLVPAGKIMDGTLRQSLWDAEITGTMQTDLGKLSIRALTLRDRMVQVIEVTSTEKDATGKALPFRFEFLPGNPDSPRAQVKPDQAAKENYQPNPDPQVKEADGISLCVQSLLAGGDYATAWVQRPGATPQSTRIYVSTANEVPKVGESEKVAIRALREVADGSLDELVAKHRAWWHQFYSASFLSVPDARIESFYWIQMYKLAAAWREDGPAIDLFGPWFRVSQWPGIWWNLNIQLTYWPVYASNHLEIGRNYLDLVDQQFDTTFVGAFKGNQIGDFAWALHNYWWQLRFAGDWEGVQKRWVPKAKRMADAYISRLTKNANGRLDLPKLGSPEFHGFTPYENTNYNLAILRWLLSALIEAETRGGHANAPEIAEWQRVRTELVDSPVDENGLMIGSTQPLNESHRHFSHLLGLYPLYQFDPDNAKDRELLIRSAKHWHEIEGGKALAGYSFTGGAAIYASLGMGDEAVKMLNDFLDNARGGGKVLPNTLYVEAGGRNPVIETPLSAASSTMDLLLQSWRGKIRVFPAVPASWKAAGFYQLRGMDGFLVSAKRENGKTAWVSIRSEAGEPCVLKVPDWSGKLEAKGTRPFKVTESAPGEYAIDLKRGEEILLSSSAGPVAPISPVDTSLPNAFGVKRGKEIKGDQSWPEVPRTSGTN